jgi:hypothetical protein
VNRDKYSSDPRVATALRPGGVFRHLSINLVPIILVAVLLLVQGESLCAETISYTYDAMHRVVSIELEQVSIVHGYDALGNRLVRNVHSGQATNQPPNTPNNLRPVSGASGVKASSTTLQWTRGDPDPDSLVRYDVYLGQSEDPPLYLSGLQTTSASLPALTANAMYYWKVRARDNFNATVVSERAMFSTDNAAPEFNGEMAPTGGVLVDPAEVMLHWLAANGPSPGDTVTYAVHLGHDSPLPLEVDTYSFTAYRPNALAPGSTYNWKIQAVDSNGATNELPTQLSNTLQENHLLNNATLTADAVLSPEHGPYVITGYLRGNNGVTLTIQPGTVLKFKKGAKLDIQGTLLAHGTESNPIVFTSIKDDTRLGDTNGDGTHSFPAGGDWSEVLFYHAGNDSRLEHVLIHYAGGNDNGAITVHGDSTQFIEYANIRYSNSYGVYLLGGAPNIFLCNFRDNEGGSRFYSAGSPVLEGNTFGDYIPLDLQNLSANALNTINDNILNGQEFIPLPDGTLKKNTLLPDVEVPCHVQGTIRIDGNDEDDEVTSLTVESGSELIWYGSSLAIIDNQEYGVQRRAKDQAKDDFYLLN